MKIGFFTDVYIPAGFGVQISVETFRKGLESLGHEVYIFAPLFKGYKDDNPRVFRFHSVKVIEKPEMRLASPFFPVNSFKEISNVKLDIVHAHTPFSMGFLGKHIASQRKIPFIYTHHTQYPEYAKVYLKEKFISPYLARVLTTWFSNISDGVIAPSQKIKRFLREDGVKKPIYILPTGVDIENFTESADAKKEIRKKLQISPGTKVLIYLGRMGREKNVEFLISMFKKLLQESEIPFNLLMVGDGPHLKEFRELAHRLEIDPFVKFTGAVPYKEVPRYYQAADAFIFSSFTDTQGIVILEALASWLPVIALKDDAFQGIVVNNENGFLIPHKEGNDEKEQMIFSKKVISLFGNSNLYRKFSQNARLTACELSEKKQAEKLLDIYKKIIAKK